MSNNVNHPPHYGGESNPYEAIKVIEAWQLGFCLGNVVKYLARAGKKVLFLESGGAYDTRDFQRRSLTWSVQHLFDEAGVRLSTGKPLDQALMAYLDRRGYL